MSKDTEIAHVIAERDAARAAAERDAAYEAADVAHDAALEQIELHTAYKESLRKFRAAEKAHDEAGCAAFEIYDAATKTITHIYNTAVAEINAREGENGTEN